MGVENFPKSAIQAPEQIKHLFVYKLVISLKSKTIVFTL